MEVGLPTGDSLSSRTTLPPTQTCALSLIFGFQFKVFKRMMVDGSSCTRLVLMQVRCVLSSDFSQCLPHGAHSGYHTAHPAPTLTGESLFLDSRGGKPYTSPSEVISTSAPLNHTS